MRTGSANVNERAGAARRNGARLLTICIVLAIAVLAACGGGESGRVTAVFINNGGVEDLHRTYQGQATTTVRFTDALGQTRVRNFTTAVVIEIGPPLQSPLGQQTETNPFHFNMNGAAAVTEEGQYSLLSANLITQASTQLVQYWRFVQQGDSFTGDLTLPQDALTPVANLINLLPDPSSGFTVPVAFPLAAGTRLAGVMTPEQISFHLDGDTTDRMHPFVSDVTATRVK